METVRISVVSYLNSKPFLFGIEQSNELKGIKISLDNPAACAKKLMEGIVDIGLVPVAVLPRLKNYEIISDYCIGSIGPVTSVMLYSDVPLSEISKIWMDYQSMSSVALTKILARKFWKINPAWLSAEDGFETKVKGSTAAVVIGDRTFELKNNYKYEYDLGEEWFKFSHLPFVFACWVAAKKLPDLFVLQFNHALNNGLGDLKSLSAEIALTGKYKTNVYEYLSKHISYTLDTPKRRGLDLFLRLMEELSI